MLYTITIVTKVYKKDPLKKRIVKLFVISRIGSDITITFNSFDKVEYKFTYHCLSGSLSRVRVDQRPEYFKEYIKFKFNTPGHRSDITDIVNTAVANLSGEKTVYDYIRAFKSVTRFDNCLYNDLVEAVRNVGKQETS